MVRLTDADGCAGLKPLNVPASKLRRRILKVNRFAIRQQVRQSELHHLTYSIVFATIAR